VALKDSLVEALGEIVDEGCRIGPDSGLERVVGAAGSLGCTTFWLLQLITHK